LRPVHRGFFDMITRVLAVAGVALLTVAAPVAAHDGRIVLVGAGSAFAAFGIGAALLGTHARPPLAYRGPSVIYLPPFSYLPPVAAPPVVYAPDPSPRG
jgi:hypothetical protein